MIVSALFNAKVAATAVSIIGAVGLLFSDVLASECSVIVVDDNGKAVLNDNPSGVEMFETVKYCPWRQLVIK